MYLARFSYDLLPVDRDRAMGFIRREVDAARVEGLNARLLVPLTRGEARPRRPPAFPPRCPGCSPGA